MADPWRIAVHEWGMLSARGSWVCRAAVERLLWLAATLAAAALKSAVCEAPAELADVNRPDLGVVVLGPRRTHFPGDQITQRGAKSAPKAP
jgi:hypothetical protein